MLIRRKLFQQLLTLFLIFFTACGSAEFSEVEKGTHMRVFLETFEEFNLNEVVEYEFGNTTSFVTMVALYQDPENHSETIFAFLTTSGGSGFINLIDEPNDFMFYPEKDIIIEQKENASIVCFSLLSNELQIVRDYKLNISPTTDGTNCSIECIETVL